VVGFAASACCCVRSLPLPLRIAGTPRANNNKCSRGPWTLLQLRTALLRETEDACVVVVVVVVVGVGGGVLPAGVMG
jgi:hypothetical protein